MRPLSPEESELWARVAATIRPLSREPDAPVESPQRDVREPAPQRVSAQVLPAPKPRLVSISDRTLDGSWDKKLRSGSVEPDRILDLHGLTLDGAWSAIDRALDQAIARGERTLVLITGHHRPGEPPVQRGKIRAAVHAWLAASRHAASIAAVRAA